ncbi:hypothetical protein OG229_02360 [Streptomyces platensis]|uniref:hypothetical protein n=1 Tax=Streptomyces platensis TaxID=58346 RepID=UPI002E0FFAD3|nr:hypothetical protein OG229_02360 [Streptomyces platensis]
MATSPYARHHYDQGNAAARDGDTQAAADHVKAIVQGGTTDDVKGVMDALSEAARQHRN